MMPHTDLYESAPSDNQHLTFRTAARIFDEQGVDFTEDSKRELGFYCQETVLYSNLAYLVSDQCTLCSKNTLFCGTTQEHISSWKTFTGSILDQISKTITFLDICNNASFDIQNVTRRDLGEYPPFALHEAVLNTFMHRDYSYGTDLFTHVFDDRMDIMSFGSLPDNLSAEQLLEGISVRRNPMLCALLEHLGYTAGHKNGIPKSSNPTASAAGSQHLNPWRHPSR